jgi:hypothetical protein
MERCVKVAGPLEKKGVEIWPDGTIPVRSRTASVATQIGLVRYGRLSIVGMEKPPTPVQGASGNVIEKE